MFIFNKVLDYILFLYFNDKTIILMIKYLNPLLLKYLVAKYKKINMYKIIKGLRCIKKI